MAKARLKILRPLLRFLACLALLVAVALLTACSTKKNTAATRWWQAFTTRYNVYFNGHEAYKEGYLAKEEGNKDNYTELIPLFTVGNEDSRELGSSNFETTVTKCEKAIQLHSIKRRPSVSPNKRRTPEMRRYLSRKEFNPFLKNAWLLMGKAQFQKGDFIEAASTFSYITRLYAPEPLVVSEAGNLVYPLKQQIAVPDILPDIFVEERIDVSVVVTVRSGCQSAGIVHITDYRI